MQKLTLLFPALLWMAATAFAQPAGYSYGKVITIQASQVPGSSSLTDFPVLISIESDDDLRTVANLGHVQNDMGWDIIFTSNDCTTQLAHQVEQYDPASGKLVAWVKIPSLSATSNTEIAMFYGNSGVSMNPSMNTVWSNGFAAVWHFDEDPSGTAPQMTELTSNASHGTSEGSMTSDDKLTGKISYCLDYDGVDDLINAGDQSALDMGTGNFTLSAWININNTTGFKEIINKKFPDNVDPGYALRVDGDAIEIVHNAGGTHTNASSSSPHTLATSTWYYISAVFDASNDNAIIYVNGEAEPSIAIDAGGSVDNVRPLRIGKRASDNAMAGKIDEPRIANTLRSADWIATEFNNQNSPSTFFTKSAEMLAAAACALLPVELSEFNVYPFGNTLVKLEWQTASETGNDYFEIQRSRNTRDWEPVTRVTGVGYSSEPVHYSALDEHPYNNASYYRLKQVDMDGKFEYSEVKSITLPDVWSGHVRIYPNPTNACVVVEGNTGEFEHISIRTLLGQDVTSAVSVSKDAGDRVTIDLSALTEGVYLLKTKTGVERIWKR